MLPGTLNVRQPTVAIILAMLVQALTGRFGLAESRADSGVVPAAAVVEEIYLEPEPGTDVIIPSFRATRFADGSVQVGGSGKYRTDGPAHAYEYRVDLARHTYTATMVDPLSLQTSERLVPQVGQLVEIDRLNKDWVSPEVDEWQRHGSGQFTNVLRG